MFSARQFVTRALHHRKSAVTRRIVTVVAVTSMVGLTAAGCATQASAAAQIGDLTISESAIFDRTTAIVEQIQAQGEPAPDVATMAELNRRQTTAAIRSHLLEVAADDKGIVITDEQVNAALAGGIYTQAASTLGAPKSMVEQTVRDLLRLEGLVGTQPVEGAPITNVVVGVDGVSVATRDEAVEIRTQFLADPQAVDATVAASPSPVQPRTVTILQDPTVAPTGVFAAEQGDVVLYPSPDGYFVLRIVNRSEEPSLLTVDDLNAQELGGKFDLGALLLERYAQAAGVTVNPRLGAWDPLTLQVVPGGSGL